MNERYLWYKDIPVLDPDNARYNLGGGAVNTIQSLENYFLDSLTPLKTASGTRVDQFSFVATTAAWNSFTQNTKLSYGVMLKISDTGTRVVKVSHVFPGTPAMSGGVQRGDQIISVDGVLVSDTSSTAAVKLNEALYPTQSAPHTMVLLRAGANFTKTITPIKLNLPQAEYKVLTAPTGKLGYLLFNSHVPDAENTLVQAMTEFIQQGVNNLVVDLRYNGGGYLAIANTLAYSVAGAARAQGKTFEMVNFSDKRSKENFAMAFSDTGLRNQVYPSLGLSKIYVLVTGDTCSASESFINGLRGIGVEVELIGSTTCGKPYGFYPQDNCGLTYAAMEFEGVNAKGEGRYSDGMVPQCAANDDLTHALGDSAEGMLSVALKRMQGLSCSQAAGVVLGARSLAGMSLSDHSVVMRPEWQNNKVLHRPR